MWKLIVYEFRSRIYGVYCFLLGLIIWDFIVIFRFSWMESIEIDFHTLFTLLFVPMILLFFILLISNIYTFYHYFLTNNLSFLFIFPIKTWKILFSKLLSVIIEFLAIYGLQFLTTITAYDKVLAMALRKSPKVFAETQITPVYSSDLLFYILNIFFVYILSLILLFGFILVIRWTVQNSKTFFWITFIFVGGYFYGFFYSIIRLIDFFDKSDIDYFQTVMKSSRFVTKETMLFLFLGLLLSFLIHWFFTKKSEF